MSEEAEPRWNQTIEAKLEEALAELAEEDADLVRQGLRAARVAADKQGSYLAGLANVRVADKHEGFATLTMDVTPNTLNTGGFVHGGFLFTLADYAMGHATRTLLDDQHSAVTLEAKINYISNVREGKLTARSEVLRHTKHLIQLETRIIAAESEELVAIVTGTFYIVPKPAED